MTQSTAQRVLERTKVFATAWKIPDDKDPAEFRWLTDYAESQAEYMTATIALLDSKADAVMRYVGIALTLVGLLLGYAIGHGPKLGGLKSFAFFLPSLFAMVLSMWSALRCTLPTQQPSRPLIAQAFSYARQQPDNSRLYLMRGWISQEFKMWMLAFEKGRCIRSALYYFMFAVTWPLIAVIAIGYRTELLGLTQHLSLGLETLVAALGLVALLGLAASRRVAGRAPLEHWMKVFPEVEVLNDFEKTPK